ncbi:glycine cleavage system aminomethyltransferase GcvT [Kineosporiaceae bacterium SCSIO 59966]|nr:glycine cleavage system aminomethyltransferase GcvT [Kineosporiaceae bacterium SCSIO 59966]
MASETSAPASPRTGPLHDRHVAAGARTAEFGGWTMPLEYPGGGVLKEHAAVREAVGLFDVSHLGKAVVRGPGAADLVNRTLTNDLARIAPGRAQYTLCCDDATGGVVDDLIVYLRSPEEVFAVPNAANAAEVIRRLRDAAPDGVEVVDQHTDLAVLAVQGPLADDVLTDVGLPAGHEYMSFIDTTWRGVPVTVCRTGYTGERGYEVLPRWEDAGEVWDALLAAVTARGGLPAGLGARDTLRTEMGYALHGHELSLDITPVMAGVGWAVGWDKPQFWGRDVLVEQRAAKSGPLARGLLARDRGVLRDGLDVVRGQGAEVVGRTTSGTFSPTLRRGIALALLDRAVRLGDEVAVDVRGRPVRCEVVRPPFVRDRTRED